MLSKANKISSCYIGPQISPEQFVQEHFFLFLKKGLIHGYDGHQDHTLYADECCIVKKNHLARYNKEPVDGEFGKVVIVFDQSFLKDFQIRHGIQDGRSPSTDAFFRVSKNQLIPTFINSLEPYFSDAGKIDDSFSKLKREELLMILLRAHTELRETFFDFGIPEKVNLEEFMNRNYKFNVGIERFAFMTGRSLTVFKQEFERIFHDTPSRWLVQRRLQEAYFQLVKVGKKPSEIYLDLGFEDLSHFSFAFKKKFGVAPTKIDVA